MQDFNDKEISGKESIVTDGAVNCLMQCVMNRRCLDIVFGAVASVVAHTVPTRVAGQQMS